MAEDILTPERVEEIMREREARVRQQLGDTLVSGIFETLGAASMCWTETPTGIFRSEDARELGLNLADSIVAALAALPEERP